MVVWAMKVHVLLNDVEPSTCCTCSSNILINKMISHGQPRVDAEQNECNKGREECQKQVSTEHESVERNSHASASRRLCNRLCLNIHILSPNLQILHVHSFLLLLHLTLVI